MNSNPSLELLGHIGAGFLVRHVDRSFHTDARCACARLAGLRDPEPLIVKDLIHVLETPARRLRVEEPGDGDEAGVEDGPDDVQLPAETVDGVRGDEDDDEVGQPVGTDADGDALVARAQRHDLRRVHPAHGQDAPGEDVEEEEDKDHEYPSCLRSCQPRASGRCRERKKCKRGETYDRRVKLQHDRYHYHAQGTAGGAPDHHCPAASLLNEEVRSALY